MLLSSVVFFVCWQYIESAWLIAAYLCVVMTVCAVLFLMQKRRDERILMRFEKIMRGESADHIADEELTPTERKLITHLNTLEAREERIRNSYRSISSLVADIAHQSKTPLSSILMYTEMSDISLSPVIGNIRTQTEKLRFLMESLTKLAKCEGGLISENVSPTKNSVKEMLCLAVSDVFSEADAKGIDIRCDIASDLTADFDIRWTAEAVCNILDNAVKYSPEGSAVEISASEYDMFVRIDIKDHGRGIPEDEICNIWKRFYRGRNSSDKKGVGIGLYLTSCIINAQGGRVSVSSSDDGSKFSVFLSKL